MIERKSGTRGSGRWVIWTVCSMFSALCLGLTLVWCNIERVDTGYDLTRLQAALGENRALASKLLVERDNLLSPHRLRAEALKLGLGPAAEGRSRRLGDAGQ